jgi:hypothetical protein
MAAASGAASGGEIAQIFASVVEGAPVPDRTNGLIPSVSKAF